MEWLTAGFTMIAAVVGIIYLAFVVAAWVLGWFDGGTNSYEYDTFTGLRRWVYNAGRRFGVREEERREERQRERDQS